MAFTVEKLSKRYRNNWVLRDITFSMEAGSVFGIFGPKCSGKTSLLEILAGSIDSNGGNWSLDDGRGLRSAKYPSAMSWIERLFGNTGKPLSSAESDLRTIGKLIAREGMDLLLLDDPLGRVGERDRDELVCSIREMTAARNLHVVIATPRFDDVVALCDRALVLNHTVVRQIGRPSELYSSPSSVDVAALTGPNNIFEARRVSSTKEALPEFHTIQGGHRLIATQTSKASLGAINRNVYLSIRPENLRILSPENSNKGNVLEGEIKKVSFAGPRTAVSIDASGLQIEASVENHRDLRVGERCNVLIPYQHLTVLKD